MGAASSLEEQIEQQRRSNQSALAHRSWFEEHRKRLTDLICAPAAPDGSGRLCVLGAGSSCDLDLPRLTRSFREVHLVDLDRAALESARGAEAEAVRARLHLHEIELSGLHNDLVAWRELAVTPEAMMKVPASASRRIAEALPGGFDVVVSACLLSQLQLLLLNVLGERHRLFAAARELQNLVHLRTLTRLLTPGGCALLVSDLTSDLTYPLRDLPPEADLCAVARELVAKGNVIYAVNPELLTFTAREDPYVAARADVQPLQHAWLWHNGPSRTFLVYALELRRR